MAVTRRRTPSAIPTDVSTITTWPWAALLLLGAGHGINPGMGWLFAVGLGLQEQRRRAVWGALLPLAAGHALAIAAAIIVALLVGEMLPVQTLKWAVAASLVGFGIYRLARHRHPRYGGMRVSSRQLVVWSFLMATAHGAGLMALPFVIGAAEHTGHASGHAMHAGMVTDDVGLLATLAHTLSYLLVTGVIAVIVYERIGLRVLRRAWLNLDVIWAAALILTGALTVLV